MLDIHHFGLFAGAALLLNLTPGPDTIYVVSHATARGVRSGAVAALGIGTGCLAHILAATLGLSALVLASAPAFAIVRYAGAAYLVWVGIGMLRAPPPAAPRAAPDAAPLATRRIFIGAALTNALNPKVALFFLAFLPQFVDPHRGHVGLQAAVLGFVFVAIATVSDAIWALGSGSLATLLRASIRARRVERYASGGILIGLGVLATLAHPARHD